MATYLDQIVEWHRARAADDGRDLDALADAAEAVPAPRAFADSLRAARASAAAAGGLPISLIAELKRRSPSKGQLARGIDPGEVAAAYERGGAACLSVLTDEPHFGGSAADLRAARAAVAVPILRKDFTVALADVYDARIMGADAVLLIVAVLDDGELAKFHELARFLGMAALVEVHDERELDRAVAVGADLIGVNQRDLHSFSVDRERAVRVASHIPPGVVKVAESGIESPDDVVELAAAGFDAVLVGERLIRADDRCAAARALLGRGAPCG